VASIFFSFSFFLSFLCIIGAVIGIVLARKAKNSGYTGGMATGGFVTSIIGLVLSCIFTLSCISCLGCAACLNSTDGFYEFDSFVENYADGYIDSEEFEDSFNQYIEDNFDDSDFIW